MSLAAATSPKPGTQALRVVVLDDDPVFRTFLSQMLSRIGLDVVAQCSSIEAARKRLAQGGVDAVTVDVVLKGESGLDFLKWCHQAHRSIITVLVTAGSERGARTGVDAVFLGAAALLTKPDSRSITGFETELRRVFADGRRAPARPAAGVTVAVRPVNPVTSAPGRPAPTKSALAPARRTELLAIGASTGGPPVLLKLLKGLPQSFDVPIVITQHMPALHIPYMTELLAAQSGRKVNVAAEGQVLMRGHAYVAVGKHLTVARSGDRLSLKYVDGAPEHFCKPAVDPMFRSVAEVCRGNALGVVLTGMGADGAKGAVALRASGNPVIIQDAETSVVWGMPGSVHALGAADGVFHVDRIPAAIQEWMGFSPRGGTR
ncbi:MAG: chemotaxis protein CheB [Myxococcaceae bacterium]|nr:chemotaxis protein CheB [Myxococcaceae bacterium]